MNSHYSFKQRLHKGLLHGLCLSGLLGASAAMAVTGGLGIELGASRSDNVKRSSSAPESDTIYKAVTDFSLNQTTRRLELGIDGVGEYNDYQNNAYDPELIASVVGKATLSLIDRHLTWLAQDNFGQVRSRPLEIDTPVNRENVNYFTTGPDVTLGLGARNDLRLQGRYSKLTYEQSSEFDENRYGGGAALARRVTQSSTLSINANNERVTFQDSASVDDYVNDDYFLRYELTNARTQFGLDLGYTKVRFDDGSDSSSLTRLTVRRQLTPGSGLNLEVGRQFMNAGNSLRQLQGVSGATPDAEPLLVAGDPFATDYALLGWSLERSRTSFYLSGSWRKEAHTRQQTLDRKWWITTAELNRQILPALSVNISGNYMSHNFDVPGGNYRESLARIGLNYQIGLRLYMALGFDHFGRTADIRDSEYSENQIWLRFGYGIGERKRR